MEKHHPASITNLEICHSAFREPLPDSFEVDGMLRTPGATARSIPAKGNLQGVYKRIQEI